MEIDFRSRLIDETKPCEMGNSYEIGRDLGGKLVGRKGDVLLAPCWIPLRRQRRYLPTPSSSQKSIGVEFEVWVLELGD